MTTQVFRALMESVAGEYGARMTAIESASKNAKEMIDVLTIQYNKARQERITKELLDIVGGAVDFKPFTGCTAQRNRRRGPTQRRRTVSRSMRDSFAGLRTA